MQQPTSFTLMLFHNDAIITSYGMNLGLATFQRVLPTFYKNHILGIHSTNLLCQRQELR